MVKTNKKTNIKSTDLEKAHQKAKKSEWTRIY